MIYLGSDHAGYELKLFIMKHLQDKNVPFTDGGSQNGETCDYPDVAHSVCNRLKDGDLAILICGTGVGMSIAANKIHGIRAAGVSDIYSAKMARLHNNANVLCLGGRVIGSGLATEIVDTFLSTNFEGGRHTARLAKIES